jgi:hypothetical protein
LLILPLRQLWQFCSSVSSFGCLLLSARKQLEANS